MTHKVGEYAEKLDKVRDITAIGLFIALALTFKLSQTFAPPAQILEETKAEEIKIEKVEVTQQVKVELAPAAVKIPVAMSEEEEETEEGATMDIEEANFDADTPPPPPPPPPAAKEAEEEAIDMYVVQEKPEVIGGDQVIGKNLVYPPMAKKAGVEGKVTLRFIVNKEGVPTNVTVLLEKPKEMGFGDAAVAALMKARFKPGVQGDKPVAVRMVLPLNFTLKK